MKVLLFIYFALLLQSFSFTDASLEEICKKASESDYNFCVTSLQVIPESRMANTKGLAIIAVDLTKANYTYNLAKTTELLKGKGLSDQVRRALESCSAAYEPGVSDLETARRNIKSESINGALVNLSEAWKRPVECEDAFKEGGEKSLLQKEDDVASRLSTLALKITILLIV